MPERGANYRNERVCVSVCVSVRSHISENRTAELRQMFLPVDSGRGSVLLWWRCDTLCTSGFVDDVMFSHNVSNVSGAREGLTSRVRNLDARVASAKRTDMAEAGIKQ